MKEKIEKIWDDHKVAISTGLIIGGAVIVTIALKKYKLQIIDDTKIQCNIKGKSWISWDPTKKVRCLNVEEVKTLLDANEQTTAAYALFREGPEITDYVCIALDDQLAWPF